MKVLIDQDMNVQVLLDTANSFNNSIISTSADISAGGMEGGFIEGDMGGDMGGMKTKDPLLSNWVFVIGITVVSLAVSIGIGILLAKRKIKKGLELYEN
ncbi:hypothetical protein KQI61_17055 [Anaerocolumna aminovalerica]|uniref:hypothetical protein n=1 Tax=Anaerocolumna aminovalerica TaxID=1527 RepID=UPI001C0EC949|nr:hypothetical protein [Anaerocolumna aminovalerica]MBU5333906.1 hypothetical protein [Anaerocolumna aminovalerica]